MNQLKGILYGVLSSATFGLIPLFALPVLRGGMDLDSLMVYRFGISTLVVGAYLLLKRENLRVSAKEFITLFGLGILYASTALFLTHSYLYIPSGVATTIHFLYPVVVTGIMMLFFRERVSLPVIGATTLAIAGVYLLSSGEGGGTVSLKGLLLVLLTVVTYAGYIVGVNKSGVSKMDGLKLTFYVLFASTLVFLVNLLVQGKGLEMASGWDMGIQVVLLALIPTLISDFALVLAIQHIGSTKTAVLGCMEPVTAVGVGVLVFHERFGILQSVGMLTILAAVLVVILVSGKPVPQMIDGCEKKRKNK